MLRAEEALRLTVWARDLEEGRFAELDSPSLKVYILPWEERAFLEYEKALFSDLFPLGGGGAYLRASLR
ncbi:hypothetical protein [Thermus tenuipuniceus]|uniref:hypothetical protein n=1 Tax=Thermus tenuipuniceus TaxID=2078690 RepID=UPI000FF8793A|nr:hypothetical protein [Thermus tenuipuniceus]